MKNNGCLFSDIQNLCNPVSDWLIQKINNPIETNETISCACCHIVCEQRNQLTRVYVTGLNQPQTYKRTAFSVVLLNAEKYVRRRDISPQINLRVIYHQGLQ